LVNFFKLLKQSA